MSSEVIRVTDGQVLTVTADAGSYGTVWQEGTPHQWTVSVSSPLHLGPGLYRIETVTGIISHSVDGQAVAALQAALPKATETIVTEMAVRDALVDAKQRRQSMALADKMKRLAERSTSVPKSLDAWADEHLAKFDALEQRGQDAFSKLGHVMADVESGVSAAEDALNQLTNGAPPGPLPS